MSEYFILVINAGSSSLKFKLFNNLLKEKASGIVEKIGQKGSFFEFKIKTDEEKVSKYVPDHDEAIKIVLGILRSYEFGLEKIKKVGHRVVHGGEEFVKPTKTTNTVLNHLRKYNKLAPLHNPNNILGIEACMKNLKTASNYAVFDTAFHSQIPDYAALYPLPYPIYKKYKIRKYGFHGISHQYITLKAEEQLKKKKVNIISCHLGSGCSVTAVNKSKSVDTSMGFTPLEGLMMSTRTGDIDPSIPLFLLEQGLGSERIKRLLNFESGLSGVAGLKDMRDIMIANGYKIPGYKPSKKLSKDQKYLAKLALSMFVYRVRKYIGAYMSVLGKVDAIVFTAGIGERNKDIRDLIVKGLPNKPQILVIPTNEELMIAQSI